jgi:hypothetical protein
MSGFHDGALSQRLYRDSGCASDQAPP